MSALIILAVVVAGWFVTATLLALVIGRAVKIADRNRQRSLSASR